MKLSRHAFTAGIAALSLAACASPAFAQGGTSGGGGGSGRPPSCTRTLIDPVMQVFVVTCTQARV